MSFCCCVILTPTPYISTASIVFFCISLEITSYNFKDATENSQKAITGIPLNGNFEVKDEPRDLYVPDLNLQNETKNILFSNGHFLGILCLLYQLSY